MVIFFTYAYLYNKLFKYETSTAGSLVPQTLGGALTISKPALIVIANVGFFLLAAGIITAAVLPTRK